MVCNDYISFLDNFCFSGVITVLLCHLLSFLSHWLIPRVSHRTEHIFIYSTTGAIPLALFSSSRYPSWNLCLFPPVWSGSLNWFKTCRTVVWELAFIITLGISFLSSRFSDFPFFVYSLFWWSLSVIEKEYKDRENSFDILSENTLSSHLIVCLSINF